MSTFRPLDDKATAATDAILDFWFGRDAYARTATAIAGEQSALWWSKNDATDADIRRRFEAFSAAAVSGQLADWEGTPRGLLALIICTDQFPRNMYRDTAQAFAADAAALKFANQFGRMSGSLWTQPIQRVFAYLPFEHSERMDDQISSVSGYEMLVHRAARASAEEIALFEGYLDFARQHHAIIKRFGRFPHRNKILGRQSTAEELEFLTQPGSSF